MPSAPTPALRLVSTVVVACAIAGAGLSFTYAATAERIAEQERMAVERALTEVLGGDAADLVFTEVEGDVLTRAAHAAGPTPVQTIFRVEGAAGELVGWGLAVAPRGYGGPVRMIVGMDSAGSVTGVKVVSHKETPGLGDKVVADKGYLAKFEGLSARDAERGAKQIDAVTGATKSSRGVRDGVIAASKAWSAALGGEDSR